MSMWNLVRAVRGHRDLQLFAALVLVIAGCGGDGCAGCGLSALPAGGLPGDQTIEGGAQVRVTPAGIAVVEGVVGDVINDSLGDGLCIPEGSQGIVIGDIDFCFRNDSPCQPGCRADLAIDSVDVLPETGQLRIRARFDVDASVPVRFDPPIFPPISCTLGVASRDTVVDAIIRLGINPASGELTVSLQDIPDLDIDPDISGCSFVGGVLDFVAGLFGDAVSDFVIDLLEPQLEELLAGLLPDPLGVANVIDLSSILGAISPGTRGALEARVVPGGYAFVEGGGLSLGIIAGVNADANPATRSAALDSEPARCVPRISAPDLTGVLGRSSRSSFTLPAAGPFRGNAFAGSDVVVGLSGTFLDLAGHHAITSGALCLGLDTGLISLLDLGAIGILAPSLGELGSGDGKEPVLLRTRPQAAIDFAIGDGTAESPSLTLHVRDFAIDFYAFLFQRYTRGFTARVDLDIGVNLEFSTDQDGNPQIMPVLVGLEAGNIGVTVENTDFLREGGAEIEGLLPVVLDLALPLLAGVLPEFTLPEFLGFRLDGLQLSRVSTDEDDFLAISATLGASPALARLTARVPGVARSVDRLAAPPVRRAAARGRARLVRVTTPPAGQIRDHLRGRGGAMPEVVIDVADRDELGRELEWTWNLGGGMWRPFRRGSQLVLRDGAFAIQGRHEIQLRSRVAGDYRTLSAEAEVLPVVIDSVGPRILGERAAADGGAIVVPAVDLVSPADRVQVAFGRAGADAPATAWASGRLSLAQAAGLVDRSGALRVWARDELGNQSTELVQLGALVQGPTQEERGGCAVGSDRSAARGLALVGLAALLGLGRALGRPARRRSGRGLLLLLLLGGALAALPACDCGGSARGDDDDTSDDGATVPDCEESDDCAGECEPGTVPICADAECRCASDVEWGRIGQYSAMSVAPDGTVWVSAYNSYHGDLMVAARSEPGRIPDEAWQFVDGVPDGPVLVPGSAVRGGVNQPGPDVGLYTDIAVAADGTVMVSYFDQDTASLKLAANRGGAWSSHVVEAGMPGGASSYEVAGQYSAISVRAGDGRPGIAYFVHLLDGDGERTELRFAEAGAADPDEAGDWAISLVDSAAVPAPSGDPLPIPRGVGLFVDAARLGDDSPVVVYYDRVNGDLKAARHDAGASAFAAPEVLDGVDLDVGWYPGLAVDASDDLHVSYVSASNQDLLYLNTRDRVVEVIDDGYREIGEDEDGVPLPEFHFVGDDSGLVLGAEGPTVAYQDATSHELLVAHRTGGGWARATVAGDEDPFAGGYGFYVSAGLAGDGLVMSTWVIDQPNSAAWVEIFHHAPPVE